MQAMDEKYMRMALQLAYKGAGRTLSNPMVGCVIVKDGKILAKGYHKKYGGDHAEIDALKKLGGQAPGATLYVNLEPCSHYGKTPPCVESVIKSGVKKVVVAMQDPNKLVSGQGFSALQQAGIEVVSGVLEDESRILNERYVKWIQSSLPFVLVKSALTLDGYMALEPGVGTPLSCEESMQLVHKLREDYDAIAVGINTVLIDNPRLTCRLPKAKRNPVRVIFDTHLQIPETAQLLREKGAVIIFCGPEMNPQKKKRLLQTYRNLQIVEVGLDESGYVDLKAALDYLGQQKITGVLVEGGSRVMAAFLKQNLADKLSLIYTPKLAVSTAAPAFFSESFSHLKMRDPHWELHGSDAWFTCYLASHRTFGSG